MPAVTLDAVFKARDEMTATMKRIERELGSVEKGLNDVAATSAQLDTVAANLGHVEAAVSGLALKAGAAGLAIGGLAGIAGKVGFDFLSMREQASVAFETMLGDADAAKQHIADLQQFAAQTPFEFQGLVKASQQLQAFGFQADAVIPVLTSIGNAAAGLGLGEEGVQRITLALGQMAAKGKASGEEFMQLAEAGIPAWQLLADTLGVTIPEAMDQVHDSAVDAGTAITAVLEGMDTRFAGLMEKQSQTAAGLLSTLKDTFDQAAGTVFEPFFTRAEAGMRALVDATATEDFTRGLDNLASGIDQVLDRLGRLVTLDPKTFFQEFGTLASDIGTMVKTEWGPAFLSWLEPTAAALGEAVSMLWTDHLRPWIAAVRVDIARALVTEWIPAFADWVATTLAPRLKLALGDLAQDLKRWIQTDGKAFWGQVGEVAMAAVGAGFAAAGEAAAGRFREGLLEGFRRQPGGRQLPTEDAEKLIPPVTGGPQLPVDEGALAARWRETQARLQAEMEAGMAAATAPPAGGGGTGRSFGDLLSNFFGGAPGTPTRTPAPGGGGGGRSPVETQLREAKTAIDGFMAGLGRESARWERMFGELGGRVATNFVQALEDGTEQSGQALARSVQELAVAMERAGVPNFQELADSLAGSLHDALLDRGNPQLKAAALELLRTVTQTLRLSSESFARAFDLASLAQQVGPQGSAVMDALESALREGGQQAIRTLANAAASMRQTLLADRDLAPERAAERWNEIWDAINTAIVDGSTEALATLRTQLAQFTFSLAEEKLDTARARKIDDAAKRFAETESKAFDDAARQIAEAQANLASSRELRAARENVDETQRQELENVVASVNRARTAWHDYREDQHVQAARAREDADLERRRGQEDADLAERFAQRRREAAGRAFTPVQTEEQIQAIREGRARGPLPSEDPVYQLHRQEREEQAALDRKRSRENAESKQRRADQDSDRQQQRKEREDDAIHEAKLAKIVDDFKRRQAIELQGFLDRQANAALADQIKRIEKQRDVAIDTAREARATAEAEAIAEHAREIQRIQLQFDVQSGAVSSADALAQLGEQALAAQQDIDKAGAALKELKRQGQEGLGATPDEGALMALAAGAKERTAAKADLGAQALPAPGGPGALAAPGTAGEPGGRVLNVSPTFIINGPVGITADELAEVVTQRIIGEIEQSAIIGGSL